MGMGIGVGLTTRPMPKLYKNVYNSGLVADAICLDAEAA